MGPQGIIGPFFYERGMSENAERYAFMLEEFVLPQIEEYPNFDRMIFMQDGAPPHFGGLEWLDDNFPDRWMGRGTIRHPAPIPWPANSPDLTWMDYFCWGYLKGKLYTDRPYEDIDSLKVAIVHEVEVMPDEMILRAVADWEKRLRVCIERNGQNVEFR
jgi:hypothetical protein